MTDPFDLKIPLLDEADIEILMHRDAHFSGNFDLMLEYYREDGVGVQDEFSIKRIQRLALYEKQTGDDLSSLLLPEASKALVEESKQMYLNLRDVYENPSSSALTKAISDLILTEDEDPEEELKSAASYGKEIVPLLIDLVKSERLYQPLFPGYGKAPLHAARVLSMIQDERAIAPLYQMLGSLDFDADETLILALTSFKEKSQEFLLKRLSHEPLSKENEHAAIVLTSMPENEPVAKECLKLLSHPQIHKHTTLANYLIIGCSALKEPSDRKAFEEKALKIPNVMKHEAEMIIKQWNKEKR